MGNLSYTTGGDSNLVSFRSAARVPITSLKAHFLPKQDLHGYSKPWPAGGGSNKLNLAGLTITTGDKSTSTLGTNNTITVTATDSSDRVVPVAANFTWIIPDEIKGNSVYVGVSSVTHTNSEHNSSIIFEIRDSNNITLTDPTVVSSTLNGRTITIPSDAAYVNLYCRVAQNASTVNIATGDSATFKNIMINYPSNVTTYSPYENICPIEGWNQCEVYQNEVYLPKEYQRIEYLESTGTEWIDTGIIPNTNTKAQIKLKLLQYTGSVVFGYFYGDDTKDWRIFSPSGTLYLDIPGSTNYGQRISGGSFKINQTYEFEIGNFYVKDLIKNNIIIQNSSSYEFTGEHSITLNNSNNVYYAKAQWYYVKIFNGNTLQRDMIPCRRKSDSKPGMYDTISQTFFTNQGTGEFICGPDVGQTVPITFPVLGKNKFNWNVEQSHASPISSDYKTARTFILNTYVVGLSGNNYYRDNYTNWVLNPSVSNGTISFESGGATGYGIGFPLSLAAGQTYFLSGTQTGNGYAGAIYYNKNGEVISSQGNRYNNTITIPSSTVTTVIIFYASTVNTVFTFSNVQLELGTEATTYEPYSSNNTVYGGYVDVVKGEVVQTWKIVDLGDYNWTYSSSTSPTYFSYQFSDRKMGAFNLYCSNLFVSDKTSPNNLKNCSLIGSTINGFVFIRYDSITSAADFISNMTGIKLAYELAESIHYPISKTELKTLLNQNNIWSNTNDNTEVSYAIHDSAPMRAARSRIIANEPHIETAIGNIATFNTDMIAPIKSAKFYFNPVQEGSGDPSPDNVREISGWTGLNINKLPTEYQQVEYIETNYSGSSSTDGTYINTGIKPYLGLCSELVIKLKNNGYAMGSGINNTDYYGWNCSPESAGRIIPYLGTGKYPQINGYSLNIFRTLTIIGKKTYVDNQLLYDYANSTNTFSFSNAMDLTLGAHNGSTITMTPIILKSAKFWDETTGNYLRYFIPCYRKSDNVVGLYDIITNNFYTSSGNKEYIAGPNITNSNENIVDWSSTAGTLYGGYIDVVSGELVQTWKVVDLGDYTYGLNTNLTGIDRFYTIFSDYGGKTYRDTPDVITDIFKPEAITVANENFSTWIVSVLSNNFYFNTPQGTYSSQNDFKTQMEGVKMAYLLNTPIYYTLIPQSLKSIRGINNIWTNTNGPVEIQYYTH